MSEGHIRSVTDSTIGQNMYLGVDRVSRENGERAQVAVFGVCRLPFRAISYLITSRDAFASRHLMVSRDLVVTHRSWQNNPLIMRLFI